MQSGNISKESTTSICNIHKMTGTQEGPHLLKVMEATKFQNLLSSKSFTSIPLVVTGNLNKSRKPQE
jgi:hypothetical protein